MKVHDPAHESTCSVAPAIGAVSPEHEAPDTVPASLPQDLGGVTVIETDTGSDEPGASSEMVTPAE